MKHSKQYFENHNSVTKLYFTSDNLAFFDEQNAINHAKNLDDNTVTSMSREEADRQVDELVNNWRENDPDYGLGEEYDLEQ